MEKNELIRLLRRTYAYVLADATRQFAQEGVLAKVTARKREEQLATGAAKAAQFGIRSVEEVFTTLSACLDCADWTVTSNGGAVSAEATRCMLCGLAKQMDAPSPCRLYCLDPMEGLAKGLDPQAEFVVQETLWDGGRCKVEVRKGGR